MNIIRTIGIIILIYAIGAPIASIFTPMNTSPRFWMQVLGACTLGASLIGGTFINFSRFRLKSQQTTKEGVSLVPSKLEDLDMKYLYYLSNRAKSLDDIEAIALLRKLQDRFFVLHHESGEPNENTTDNTTKPTVKLTS